MSDVVSIRLFRPGDEAAFHDINIAWIERFFVVEKKDRETLEHPREAILDKGGAILMAVDSETAIGCVALIAMGEGGFELAKMGVSPVAQGKGTGRKLIQAAIDHAHELGARRLYLETNSALKPALKLYADAGFEHVKGPPSPYARADVQMELWLG
ncbi:MAG: GNAT family N-acetyltransferase [Alphaproteobacteria bacterium]